MSTPRELKLTAGSEQVQALLDNLLCILGRLVLRGLAGLGGSAARTSALDAYQNPCGQEECCNKRKLS